MLRANELCFWSLLIPVSGRLRDVHKHGFVSLFHLVSCLPCRPSPFLSPSLPCFLVFVLETCIWLSWVFGTLSMEKTQSPAHGGLLGVSPLKWMVCVPEHILCSLGESCFFQWTCDERNFPVAFKVRRTYNKNSRRPSHIWRKWVVSSCGCNQLDRCREGGCPMPTDSFPDRSEAATSVFLRIPFFLLAVSPRWSSKQIPPCFEEGEMVLVCAISLLPMQ